MTRKICIFGEVLFDIFADGQQVLGGAPFNVAWHLQAFGLEPCFISRIGNDSQGEQINRSMLAHGMDTGMLQQHDQLPTGQVTIELNDGEPHYDIVSPCAYDAIDKQPCEALDCDVLYHGSLALRHSKSAHALQALIETTSPQIFLDVNLRQPWWDKKSVLNMINRAHWTKLNSNEFDQLYPGKGQTQERLKRFVEEFQLESVILTHGEKGAEVRQASGQHFEVKPEKNTNVVDTVGAGDAFSAVTLAGIINHWPMPQTLQRAQTFASQLVSQRGATLSDPKLYSKITANWH